MKNETDLARILELRTAERDGALAALDSLERILTRVAGYMDPKDQEKLHAARALLIESGTRKSDAPSQWSNRTDDEIKKLRERTMPVNGTPAPAAIATVAKPTESFCDCDLRNRRWHPFSGRCLTCRRQYVDKR